MAEGSLKAKLPEVPQFAPSARPLDFDQPQFAVSAKRDSVDGLRRSLASEE